MDVIAPRPQKRAANGPHAGRERTPCRLVVESKVTNTRRKETDRKDETSMWTDVVAACRHLPLVPAV